MLFTIVGRERAEGGEATKLVSQVYTLDLAAKQLAGTVTLIRSAQK